MTITCNIKTFKKINVFCEHVVHCYFIAFFIVACAARIISLSKIDSSVILYTTEYWVAFLRATSSDAVSSLLVAAICLLSRRSHVLFYLISLLWAYFHSANIDFIESNQSYLPFFRAGEGLDKTFFLGSALSFSVLSKAAFLFLMGMYLFFVLRKKIPIQKRWMGLLQISALAGVAIIPYQAKMLAWQQMHMFEGNALKLISNFYGDSSFDSLKSDKQLADKYRHTDMSGTPRFTMTPPTKPPNIIFLVIEALSSHHVDAGWMPYLKSMKENSLYFPNFLNLNRMTINGTFTINCATYPPLASRQHYAWRANNLKTIRFLGMPTKSNHKVVIDIARNTAKEHPCLPLMLRDHGYSAHYLQGADIHHTSKHILLPILGFQKAYGAERLKKRTVLSGWGIDDGTLINYYGIDYIRKLQADPQPWILYFMTLGTHHPFRSIPKDFRPEEKDNKKRSFLYVDSQVQQFMETLNKEGVLDNTIVFITNDESGFSPLSNNLPDILSANKGLLLVHTPQGYTGQINDLYTHADIYVSVLDYLNIPLPEHVRMGRSIFRSYTNFRPIVFSNSYMEALYGITRPNEFTMCNMSTRMFCSTYTFDKTSFFDAKFSQLKDSRNEAIELIQAVKSVFEGAIQEKQTTKGRKLPKKKNNNRKTTKHQITSFPLGD